MMPTKILTFVFLAIVLSIKLHAQKIGFDRMESGGIRHAGTDGLEIKLGDATYNFSLTVFSGRFSKEYCLLISSIWKIDEKCVLMLKLGNDEVMKLEANNINVGQIDYPKYDPIIGSSATSGLLSTQKVNYYVSLYSLDSDLLRKIEKEGISKIRIAFDNTYFEKTWKKDSLGRYIKKCHDELEVQLSKPNSSLSRIEENF